MTDLALSHTFLQTLASFNRFSLSAAVMAEFHGVKTLSYKSFLAILTTEECEIPVSLVISRGLLLVDCCHPWLRIKSLANSMFESVLTEQRRPLSSSLSTLPVE